MHTESVSGARCFQTMVPMRDGIRLNTFVFLPESGEPRYPVIVHRTPYGITAPGASSVTDCTRAWLPSATEPWRGSILRGWRSIVTHGYAAVYQDTRGRYGSEGEDYVYGDDAEDGYDTLEWIAQQPWSNQMVGMSGSSAGATTTFAAASQRHPSLRAFFVQVGGSSIYDDVVCEGQSIEMERLWLWVAKNIPGLSASHRETVRQRLGLTEAHLDAAAVAAAERYTRLEAARQPMPTLGGRNMLIDAGPRDQRPAQALPNYGLIYLGEVLAEDLTIAGPVRVTLHVQSDCRDTDFIAKLIEVEPDGRAMLLMDGVVRAMYREATPVPQLLMPDHVYRLSIHLGDIHHTCRAGSRIAVDVTSSNFPRRARNTNSGHAVLAYDTAADIRVATNTVHHDAARPSCVEMLVLTPDRRTLQHSHS